jgi:hypothetical protein
MMARLTNVASIGFFSKTFRAGAGKDVSTMNMSAVISVLGAFGNSFAAETPARINTANTEHKIDFMNRDYVGTCTSAIARR